MTAVSLVMAPPIASLTDEGGWVYRGVERVAYADALDRFGNLDDVTRGEDWRLSMEKQNFSRKVYGGFVDSDARTPESVVGYGLIHLPVTENTESAFVSIVVDPARRREGIGAQIMAWVESVLAQEHRPRVMSYVLFAQPANNASTISPASGGSFPADAPGWLFASRHGFTLEQVERRSVCDIPVDPALLNRLESAAAPYAEGYRLHSWRNEIPDAFIDHYAAIETRMTADAPQGGIDIDEVVWTPERLRQQITMMNAAGKDAVMAAAEHVASGVLAGVMDLHVARAGRPDANQEDTIVLPEHRGHRLGMLLKIANLRRLAADYPHIERIYTWNATENGPMLAINVALGFRPDGGAGELQRSGGSLVA